MVDEKYERIEKEAISISHVYEKMAEEYWLDLDQFLYIVFLTSPYLFILLYFLIFLAYLFLMFNSLALAKLQH